MNVNSPTCAVLLATYNGERWLQQQMDSLSAQQGVNLRVIVSDDMSSDGTIRLLSRYRTALSLTILPTHSDRFGCANRNFLRLIIDSDIGDAEYVALADQDDIWCDGKLRRAINQIKDCNYSGYSSDFEAFWEDGRKRLVKKSHPQKNFDYLFGSPGPGCTFVFTRALFFELRTWIKANFAVLSHLWVHDWIFYAYARSHGHRWFIDNIPTILYRQHDANEIGVNSGIAAFKRRLAVIRDGRYRHNIVIITELTGAYLDCAQALRRMNWYDRFWLIRRANQFRRSLLEVWVLRLIFLLMPALPIPDAKDLS